MSRVGIALCVGVCSLSPGGVGSWAYVDAVGRSAAHGRASGIRIRLADLIGTGGPVSIDDVCASADSFRGSLLSTGFMTPRTLL